MDEFTVSQKTAGFDPANFLFIIFFILAGLLALWLAAKYLKYFFTQKSNNYKFRKNQDTTSILSNLGPFEFEAWVQQLFLSLGAKAVVTGKRRNDHGIDVEVEYGGKKIAVQCKRYTPLEIKKYKVGEVAVRDLYGVKWGGGYSAAMLITTGKITYEAQDWAKGKKDLILIDGGYLDRIAKNRNLLKSILDSLPAV